MWGGAKGDGARCRSSKGRSIEKENKARDKRRKRQLMRNLEERCEMATRKRAGTAGKQESNTGCN